MRRFCVITRHLISKSQHAAANKEFWILSLSGWNKLLSFWFSDVHRWASQTSQLNHQLRPTSELGLGTNLDLSVVWCGAAEA